MPMSLCAKFGRPRVLRPAARASTLLGGDQKFDIAFGTRDRAFDQAEDGPAFRFEPCAHIAAHPAMDRRVAPDALLAALVPRGLELRLDARDHPRARPGAGANGRAAWR